MATLPPKPHPILNHLIYIGAKYRGIHKVFSKNPIVSLLPLLSNGTCSSWSQTAVNYYWRSITTNIKFTYYKVEHPRSDHYREVIIASKLGVALAKLPLGPKEEQNKPLLLHCEK